MPEQIVYQLNPDEPVPGSESAEAQGCTCPRGLPGIGNVIYPGGHRAWRVQTGCPVHDPAQPGTAPARESHPEIMRRVRGGLAEIVRLTDGNLYDVMAANEAARKLLQEIDADEH